MSGKIGSVMLMRSKDFLEWADDWFGRMLKRSTIGRAVDRVFTDFFQWARINSLFPLHFGIMCCALEMGAASAPRFDAQRFGVIYRSTPRQCDILLVNGPVSKKLKPDLKRLYDQMADPKWVVAMGECSISGGPFWQSYSIIEGVDKFIPVDVYIPGCPVRPEAMIEGIVKLQDKIRAERKGVLTEDWIRK